MTFLFIANNSAYICIYAIICLSLHSVVRKRIMDYLNQFHKEASERKMRKITQRREMPMSDYEAVAEMFRNHRMALAMERGEDMNDGKYNMISIDEALQIALRAHRGRKDQNGNPAILHSLALGLAGRNREEMIAGFLYGVLDNPRITIDYLRAVGVDESILGML